MTDDDWPLGAIAVTKNLDLLVEQDEPVALVEQLRQVAESAQSSSSQEEMWELIAKAMVELSSDMSAKNEPGHKVKTEEE
jgi:hypothetical protein